MEAFLQIKAMLLELPLIALSNTSLPFALFCDATLGTEDMRGGIGSCLTQNFDEITKPTGYYSHHLKDNEMRYSTFNAEMTCSSSGTLGDTFKRSKASSSIHLSPSPGPPQQV